jgi:enoyl-CoA hydratase/carnithine racemase
MSPDLAAATLETLRLDQPGEHVLRITLSRERSANALNTRMGEELIFVFGALEAKPWLYRCVILTAAGQRVFCAGADLKERDGMDDAAFNTQHYLFERMIRAISDCPVPTIAAINGAAVAGGLELVLACDFAYAADHARFGFPEVLRGIMPGGGGTQHLARIVGAPRAKELILTGESFGSEQAMEWGVVNKVLPGADLTEAAIDTALVICANAPIATAQAKKSIAFGQQMDLRTGLFFEAEAYSRLVGTEDRREGIAAFNEKRQPVFRGR